MFTGECIKSLSDLLIIYNSIFNNRFNLQIIFNKYNGLLLKLTISLYTTADYAFCQLPWVLLIAGWLSGHTNVTMKLSVFNKHHLYKHHRGIEIERN